MEDFLRRSASKVLNKEAIFHFLFWGFFMSSVQVDWMANWLDRSLRPNNPSPLSTILLPIFFYLNTYWFIPKYLKQRSWSVYFLLTIWLVLGIEFTRIAVFVLFQPQSIFLYPAISVEFWSRDSLLFGIPFALWQAYFLSFAYRFTKDWITNNKLIEQLRVEKMAMELSLLKSQINPHFLFNNLNALDDLIDRDRELAKAYLHKLSKIYRYSIVSMDKNVVNLKEEWDFITDYIYLIEERYGGVYQFKKANGLETLDDYLIPPASLQTLIENVVKHNEGSLNDPLVVSIDANPEGITVRHPKRPKLIGTNSLGTGLKNLRARYRLLSNKDIIVKETNQFIVTLPLIKQIQ